MRHFRMGPRGLLLLIVAIVLLALAGGVAYATGGQPGVVYTACKLNSTGAVRLIDPALPGPSLLGHCTANETQVTWNQQGPPGINGTNGADGAACLPSNPACVGPKGDKGDPGTNGTNGIDGTDGAPCLPSNPLCVGPKGDKGDPGTDGTNGTDGKSPLWIVVDGATGTALRGSGFAAAGHAPSAGVYRITWGTLSPFAPLDISNCGYSGTLLNTALPGGPGGEIVVTPGVSAGQLFVSTFTDAGAPVDDDFSVEVFC